MSDSPTTKVSALFDSLTGKTNVHLSIEEIGAASGPESTSGTLEQIVIEQVREDDESTCWAWDVFGVERRIAGGHAKTLSDCLDNMREYLKDDGLAP